MILGYFVGYEVNCVGWHVHDLHGKYSFSNDVIFNESSSGHLGVSWPLSSPDEPLASSGPLRPACDRSHVRTSMGQAYDEVLRLKAFRCTVHDNARSLATRGADGGATTSLLSVSVPDSSIVDLSPSLPVLDVFYSLIASSLLPDLSDMFSFAVVESCLLVRRLWV